MTEDGGVPDAEVDQGAAAGAPVLALDGYTGPLPRLLALARAHQVDLARLSLPDLVDQLAAAVDRAGPSVPLGQRADWLVMAAWLLQLRSRLLLPRDATAADTADATLEADRLRHGLAGLDAAQALATWLTARPQLGHDVFARGQPEWGDPAGGSGHPADVIEFLWAALTLFDADLPAAKTAAAYRPAWLDLHTVADARARIRRMLPGNPEGYTLGQLRPPPSSDGPAQAGREADTLKRRSGWSSTFVACLELAKSGELRLGQEGAFAPIQVQHGTSAPALADP